MSVHLSLDESIDLQKIFKIIWQKKYSIILITTFFSFLSAVFTLLLPNIYLSSATLIISDENSGNLNSISSQADGLAKIAGISLGNSGIDKIAAAKTIIESQNFFEILISEEWFFFNIAAVEGWDRKQNKLVIDDNIYDESENKWISTDPFSFNGKPSNQAVHRKFLKENFLISSDESTGLVTVSLRHFSPEVSKKNLDFIIKKINETFRNKDIENAQNSIYFLREELSSAKLSDLRIAINNLIAKQIEKIALAKASPEYYFKVLSSPEIPELKTSPSRYLIVLLCSMLSFFIISFFFIVKNYKNDQIYLSSK